MDCNSLRSLDCVIATRCKIKFDSGSPLCVCMIDSTAVSRYACDSGSPLCV